MEERERERERERKSRVSNYHREMRKRNANRKKKLNYGRPLSQANCAMAWKIYLVDFRSLAKREYLRIKLHHWTIGFKNFHNDRRNVKCVLFVRVS